MGPAPGGASLALERAPHLGIPHWQVVPCLVFTLMLGPVGLVLYLTLRRITRGQGMLSTQP